MLINNFPITIFCFHHHIHFLNYNLTFIYTFIFLADDILYPVRNKNGDIETLVNPNIDSALTTDSDSRTNVVYNRYHHLPLDAQRQKLPVFQYRNHILYLLEKYQTLILIGETGCGKSTQVPQVSFYEFSLVLVKVIFWFSNYK